MRRTRTPQGLDFGHVAQGGYWPAPLDPGRSRGPEPPYIAVIFTSVRRDGEDGYDDMSKQMVVIGPSAGLPPERSVFCTDLFEKAS